MSVGKKLALLAVIAAGVIVVPSGVAFAEDVCQQPGASGVSVRACASVSSSSPGQSEAQVSVSQGPNRVYVDSVQPQGKEDPNQGRVRALPGFCAGFEPDLPSTLDPTACVNSGYRDAPTSPWNHCALFVSPLALGHFGCGAPVG